MNTLVIEDDAVVRKVLGVILAEFGDVSFASNGTEGVLRMNEALSADKPFDLICLDIMMPQMSGKETLKLIRDIEVRNNVSSTKVLVISALTSDMARREFDEQEDILFIEKPFRKELLRDRLLALEI